MTREKYDSTTTTTQNTSSIRKIIGHPVLIGDVIEEMINIPDYTAQGKYGVLIQRWANCGSIASKSLNEIFKGEIIIINRSRERKTNTYEFKDRSTQDLYEFLLDIFKEEL